jgi:AcrR family transcriptional regulator
MAAMSSPKTKSLAMPQGTKRERTREKLVSAAGTLFQARGIAAVSLDEVAAHAGLTKGAIYGNFESKEDLVYAVAIDLGRRPKPIFNADEPIAQQLKRLVADVSAKTPGQLKRLAFLTELDLYVLTHESVKKRMYKLAHERYREAADNLTQVARNGELPLPPLEFAIVVHALFNGLLYQRAIWPEVVTDEVMLNALRALVGARL